MPESWQESHAWADRFTPHVKQLLGLACIQVAALDEDRQHNTDLMFEVGYLRFPVRIRRIEHRLAFNRRNEVTFRFQRRSGMQTEFAKLLCGWGDCFLYGWGDDVTGQIRAYTVLDLHQFRYWYTEAICQDARRPGQIQEDRDGSASFIAFCLDCLPPVVIKRRVTLLSGDPPVTDLHWQTAHAIGSRAPIAGVQW
jgi:hypothetical protein